MGEDVLAVARAVAQLAEQLGQLRVQGAGLGVEHGLLADLDDVVVHLGHRLVVGGLDARRVDAPVLE